jgi:hypothetical protein
LLVFQIKANPEKLLVRGKTVFTMTCFLLAAIMTLTQIFRLLENADSSSFTYKPFNLTPLDKYPTYSICFRGPEIYWKHEQLLFNSLGMTSSQYVELLKGDGWRYQYDRTRRRYEKEDITMKNASNIVFKETILRPSDVFKEVDFVAQENNETRHYWNYGRTQKGREIQQIPFHIGYQTPGEICFTRNSSDTLNLIRAYDLLSLNRSLLKRGNHLNLELRIIFHYPGQLVRNFHKPSFRFTLGSFETNVLELMVYHVTKLINRPDANIRCNNGIEIDDFNFQHKIIKLVGCVPVYFDERLRNGNNEKFCESPKALKKAFSHIEYYKDVLASYEPPCLDMKIMVKYFNNIKQEGEKHFLIKIVYRDSFFQEIKNLEDFTLPTFWSNIGGLLGICLGYSLLQIPELIKNFLSLLKRSRYSTRISEYLALCNKLISDNINPDSNTNTVTSLYILNFL